MSTPTLNTSTRPLSSWSVSSTSVSKYWRVWRLEIPFNRLKKVFAICAGPSLTIASRVLGSAAPSNRTMNSKSSFVITWDLYQEGGRVRGSEKHVPAIKHSSNKWSLSFPWVLTAHITSVTLLQKSQVPFLKNVQLYVLRWYLRYTCTWRQVG